MNPHLMALLGGSAILIYSIDELSRNVQYLAGSRFRAWINALAQNRIYAILLGGALSILLSSSGAVTVMLVGLANSRLLTLEQVFAVTLGASIGTTFIVQLFAFRVSNYALLIIFISVLTGAMARSDRSVQSSRAIMHLGLMFFSMQLVVDAGIGMESDELFRFVINYFRDRPMISLLLATGFTALIHSSAATIAFVMSLMVARQGNIYEAIPWVLGANLGTTTTAYFASFRTGPLGKQAALGNLVCKVTGIILCYPLMFLFGDLVLALGGDISRQVANAHTMFNILVAILFFPFISFGVRLVRHLIPEKSETGPFHFYYLDPKAIESPEIALAQAQREVLRLSDAVEEMVSKSIPLFVMGRHEDIEKIKSMDRVVDYLNKGIKMFLTKLSQKEMTPEQVQKEFEFLLRTNDLESIGDIVDKNILELVKKNLKKGYVFSKEGWLEIMGLHGKVVDCLRISTAYFNSRDPALEAKLISLYEQIEDMMIDLSEQHVHRLHEGVKESMDTTSVHLDLLMNLQRVASLSVRFVRRRGRGELGNL